jgi:hypothetical protein
LSTEGERHAGDIWQFLKDHDNLAVITAIAVGAWAVFTFVAKKSEKGPSAPQPSTTVTVQTPVTVNPDAKDVVAPINERLDKLAAQVARDKGVEIAPLRAILVKLGEADVKDEDILKRLDEKADAIVKFRPNVDALRIALQAFVERDSGVAPFEEAVAAYREALQEFTGERVPL